MAVPGDRYAERRDREGRARRGALECGSVYYCVPSPRTTARKRRGAWLDATVLAAQVFAETDDRANASADASHERRTDEIGSFNSRQRWIYKFSCGRVARFFGRWLLQCSSSEMRCQ